MSDASSRPSLQGQCGFCSGLDGVLASSYSAFADYYLCPNCLKEVALWRAAEAHLEELVVPVLNLWNETWGDLNGISLGAEALYALSERLRTYEADGRRGEREK